MTEIVEKNAVTEKYRLFNTEQEAKDYFNDRPVKKWIIGQVHDKCHFVGPQKTLEIFQKEHIEYEKLSPAGKTMFLMTRMIASVFIGSFLGFRMINERRRKQLVSDFKIANSRDKKRMKHWVRHIAEHSPKVIEHICKINFKQSHVHIKGIEALVFLKDIPADRLRSGFECFTISYRTSFLRDAENGAIKGRYKIYCLGHDKKPKVIKGYCTAKNLKSIAEKFIRKQVRNTNRNIRDIYRYTHEFQMYKTPIISGSKLSEPVINFLRDLHRFIFIEMDYKKRAAGNVALLVKRMEDLITEIKGKEEKDDLKYLNAIKDHLVGWQKSLPIARYKK